MERFSRSLWRRRAAPPNHAVAPGDCLAVGSEDAGLAEAGDGVLAEALAFEKAAEFVDAIGLIAAHRHGRIGVGRPATVDADIFAIERGRRFGGDNPGERGGGESQAQGVRRRSGADGPARHPSFERPQA